QNIAIGDLSPDMNEIMKLCKQLDMLSFIDQLPAGSNTYVCENGAQLSGGQRQRIAIARALYRHPEVLILDEATASLDSVSESHVHRAITDFNREGKTVAIIAHRLSTVMNADKIVVLHQGVLVEEGNHSSLMNIKGHYYNMWQQQFPPEFALLGKPLPRN